MRPHCSLHAARLALLALAALALLAAPAVSARPPRPGAQTHPGDQGAIAFARLVDPAAFRFNIFRMDVDGHNVTNLSDDAFSDNEPAWSASGTQLAFVSDRDPTPLGTIWRMTATGAGLKQLTTSTDPVGFDGAPAWYPGDDRIIFASNRATGGSMDLWYQDVDTGGSPVGDPVRLTTGGRDDVAPAVSPDGKLIAFASDRVTPQNPQGDFEIFVLKANAPEGPDNPAQQLTKNDVDDTNPDWKPNGQKLAFAREQTAGGPHQIYTMTRQGKQQQPLTSADQDALHPSWSPDGQRLAYAVVGEFRDIYRINADGTQSVNLTEGSNTDNDQPVWQPR